MDRKGQIVRSYATATPEEEPLLSPRLAFVVQFRAKPGAKPELFAGRVEHMVSGHAAHFHSREELLAFLTRVLNEVQV